jgi:uncharacterized membrane protein YphA (DoxX/SURF4 family)
MNTFAIPLEVVYAGLAGTLLALLVAAAVNKWSPKVFFLLALRLAIGWHFLFEGLYKVQTHYGPPTETTKPFSSEPYFRAAPGPIGGFMRRQFEDPTEVIADRVKRTKEILPEVFAKLPLSEQIANCPTSVAQQLDGLASTAANYIKSEAEKELKNLEIDDAKAIAKIASDEEKDLKESKSDEEKDKAKAKAEEERKKLKEHSEASHQAIQKKIDQPEQTAQKLMAAAKASYARWVYGAEGRNAKVKFITGDVALTAPERLSHIERLRSELKEAQEKQAAGLGNGYSIDSKRAAELRMDLIASETDLARDANAFVVELKKELAGKAPEEVAPTSRGHMMDIATMWFLVGVGICLMAGLFTRLACLLGAGFLVVTYLAHPAFPWFPIPPNTEGNPVFVNKNVIEFLALLSLMCMPTGRWLGLDAIVLRPFCRYKSETNRSQPAPQATQAGHRRYS